MQVPWAICMRIEEQKMKTAELGQSHSQLLVEYTQQLVSEELWLKRI